MSLRAPAVLPEKTARAARTPHRPEGRSRTGRADLVRIVAGLGENELLQVAGWMGYEVEVEPLPVVLERSPVPRAAIETPVETAAPETAHVTQANGVSLPLLRLEEARFTDKAVLVPASRGQRDGLTREDIEATGRSLFATPPMPPLAPWRRLWPVLRDCLQVVRTGPDPDVTAVVRALGRGRVLRAIPRLPRGAWTTRLSLWIDGSRRLTPLFEDQALVCRALERACGKAGLKVRRLDAVHAGAPDADARGRPIVPEPGTPILVLGDLGAFGAESDRAAWLRAARRLRREGAQLSALVPTGDTRTGAAIAWNAVAWERAGMRRRPGLAEDPSSRAERAARLLALASAAVVVQPGLLRALRRLLPAWEADLSTELDVWNGSPVRSAGLSGLVLHDGARESYREKLAACADAALLRRVSASIDEWHSALPAEIVHAETIAWCARIPADVAAPPGKMAGASGFLWRFANSLEDRMSTVDVRSMQRDRDTFLASVPEGAYRDSRVQESLWRLRLSAFEGPEAGPPPPCGVSLMGRHLVLRRLPASGAWPQHDVGEPGSPVAWLPAGRSRLRVLRGAEKREEWHVIREGLRVEVKGGEDLLLETDQCQLLLRFWSPEPWTSGVGRDRFGLWADAEVGGVVQRFRWIPPGRFVMGSPGSEQGRVSWEGPQHQVTFTQGNWLADTSCTQALWQAVMGRNPSRFVSPDRPVEQVSWEDCQELVARLARRMPELAARLPGEAEWEHACRAGTSTATWLGDLVIRGDNDAPLLHAIAWYGGNCGVDFDLDDGHDTKNWPSKQSPHERGGTRRVGQKDPGPFGLFDMLGNVYEWCADHTEFGGGYEAVDVTDPAPSQVGVSRVLRGGSWDDGAGDCRAAFRLAGVPRYTLDDVGFRLALGRAASEGAEPQERTRSVPDNRVAGRGPATKDPFFLKARGR